MQWLPYPKNTPTRTGWYIATIKRGTKPCLYGVNVYYFSVEKCDGWLINKDIEKVIAFMELPTPYEE